MLVVTITVVVKDVGFRVEQFAVGSPEECAAVIAMGQELARTVNGECKVVRPEFDGRQRA